jgi:hypothetical protein
LSGALSEGPTFATNCNKKAGLITIPHVIILLNSKNKISLKKRGNYEGHRCNPEDD